MKLYCSCGLFVADIKESSRIRKGAVMICSACLERYKLADSMARMTRNMPDKKYDLPPGFEELLGDFGNKRRD